MRLREAGFRDDRDVNGDAVRFIRTVVAEYGTYAAEVYLGGLMACANDAYRPEQALPRQAAMDYHAPQAEALARAGVDFILAATLPAYEEAVGLAHLLGRFDPPYILSFVVRSSGKLLDGMPLWRAIDRIDTLAEIPPAFYMVNCVHPECYASAMTALSKHKSFMEDRVLGLQANSSSLPPEKLDGLDHIEEEDPERWALLLRYISRVWPLRMVGGCCGTDARHIAALARELVEEIGETETRRARVW
jgi:homocysteine S-methyltransferase